MITFQKESWDQYYPECIDLWDEHNTELNRGDQFNIDINTFKNLDNAGCILIVTIRENSKLIGYHLSHITKHLYLGHKVSYELAYYLKKDKRKGLLGIRLITEPLKYLKELGIEECFFMTLNKLDRSPIFEKLGFKKHATTFCKKLQ